MSEEQGRQQTNREKLVRIGAHWWALVKKLAHFFHLAHDIKRKPQDVGQMPSITSLNPPDRGSLAQ